jgi:hypothetical protein
VAVAFAATVGTPGYGRPSAGAGPYVNGILMRADQRYRGSLATSRMEPGVWPPTTWRWAARSILTMLALDAGVTASTDRPIAGLWGPPQRTLVVAADSHGHRAARSATSPGQTIELVRPETSDRVPPHERTNDPILAGFEIDFCI